MGGGKKEIKIGAILPLSGDNAAYGVEIRKGVELGAAEINAEGGINGKQLHIVFEDDQADPQKTVSAYKKLTKIHGICFIIGGVFSSSTLAIAPLAEREKVVLLSPTSSAIEISNVGDYVFRIYPSDSLDCFFLAEFAYNKLHARSVAVLYLQASATTAISKFFKKRFEELGGHIVLSESHNEGDNDFRSSLSKIKGNEVVDIIFIPSYLREMAILLKQARELGIRSQFLSISTFYDPKIVELTGEAAEGVIFSAPLYNAKNESPLAKRFVSQFKKAYRSEPGIWSAYGYDVARVAAEGLKKGYNSSAIKEALYKIKDFSGVTGSITFDKNGDVVKQLEMFIVKNGKFQRLSEEELNEVLRNKR